jgi:hypothetical protein
MKTRIASVVLILVLLGGFVGELLYFSSVPQPRLATSATNTVFKVSDKICKTPEIVTAVECPLIDISENETTVEVYDEPIETEVYDYEEYNYISYNVDSSCLTKDAGVNYYGGRTETWYSSNLLYHHMTPEWELGDDGVYRDNDGYVVVACTDISYGEVVDTSLGLGKVYDCGCAVGVTDIYTAW